LGVDIVALVTLYHKSIQNFQSIYNLENSLPYTWHALAILF